MISNLKTLLKYVLAVISFIAGIVIGFIALFLPPRGMIDNSVLVFIAQLLIFTSNILGFNINVPKSVKDIQPDKKD